MKRNYVLAVLAVVVIASFAASTARAEQAYDLAWVRQTGTTASDESLSVAVDGLGNAYISGATRGSLGGPNAGLYDAFLAKYDSFGSLLWTRQIGTTNDDRSSSVAVDVFGNAFISGYTEGSLSGPHAGDRDAFLAKYDPSGGLLWTRQLGTAGYEESGEVAVDAYGNAYICGPTFGDLGGPSAGSRDAFLVKYDPSGAILWKQQLGTSGEDQGASVAVDAYGNAYVSGWTAGDLAGSNAGGWDAFLAKYDSSGSLLWKRQMGTSSREYSESVAVDAFGNAYISGPTFGSLGGPNAGDEDIFLAKYDPAGSLLWVRQIGTSSSEPDAAVAVDGLGNAYIGGDTGGSLGGPNAGSVDAFLAKYDSSGALLWTRQMGTTTNDYSYSVAVDGLGNAYISGYTGSSICSNPYAGGYDAFLAKYTAVPEAGTVFMVAAALVGMAAAMRRKI